MTNDQMTNDANDNQMTPHHLAFVISQITQMPNAK
jgi:hypothetical protein